MRTFRFLLLLSPLLVSCATQGNHKLALAELDKSHTKIQELRRQIKSLRETLEGRTDETRKLKDRLKNLTVENKAQSSDLDLLSDRNQKLASDLLKAEDRVKDFLEIIDSQSQDFQALQSQSRKNQESLQDEVEALTDLLRNNSRDLEIFRKRTLELEQSNKEAQERIREIHNHLTKSLTEEMINQKVDLSYSNEQLEIRFSQELLFASGHVELQSLGVQVLDRLGSLLTGLPNLSIEVQGHTDNVPIGPRLEKRFPTNWELSASRASRVVRHLSNHLGNPGPKIAAIGFSDTQPVADNETEEGRALNRRIEIIIRPIGDPTVKTPPSSPEQPEQGGRMEN